MDYTERIQELQTLRDAIANKQIDTNQVSSIKDTIDEWEGKSPNGYAGLVEDTKEIVESIYAIKEEVLGVIDERIAQLEIAIDDQFDRYKYIAYSTYDDDSNKNRLQQLEKINGVSSLDSSVRSRLINLV